MNLVSFMHIDLLFPVVLCFCRCLWQDFFSPESQDLNSYVQAFTYSCLWMWWFFDRLLCFEDIGPRANQNHSFTLCSDLRVTANQIIFHTSCEKSHGLDTLLAMENHRRSFSNFFWGKGEAVHRLKSCGSANALLSYNFGGCNLFDSRQLCFINQALTV